MAIFDEYKQAVQDVLNGRAKEPSLPFAFSDEGDMLAALYAAAAALSLSKEAPGGGGGSGLPDTPGTDGTYALMNTVENGTGAVSWVKPLFVTTTNYGPMSSTFEEISDAHRSGRPVIVLIESSGEFNYSFSGNIVSVNADVDNDMYRVLFISDGGNISSYTTFSRNGYPEYEY